jgi:hypothetical protein
MSSSEPDLGMQSAAKILKRLIENQIELVVIGGVAALIHGSTVVTRDVDICIRFNEVTLRSLAKALADLNPKHRITPQRLPFEIRDDNWAMFKNVYLETDWGKLDCLGEVPGLGKYDDLVSQSEVAQFPFGSCRVLTIDALIRAKETAGRPHDFQVTRQLRIIQQKQKTGG